MLRDVSRILSFLVICRLLLGVENCMKVLINSFILLITFLLHNDVVMKPSEFYDIT